ncbi:MAG: FkbM family methyltransferase [Candidatus Omnitrophica bacterium]|nr:FkbM family methyltransferase [Candidatus Omnitrophota bacterium]
MDPVGTYSFAIPDKAGPTTFCIHDNTSWADSLYRKSEHAIGVEAVTLKDVLDANGIGKCHLLKIDTEASEYAVLRACRKPIGCAFKR